MLLSVRGKKLFMEGAIMNQDPSHQEDEEIKYFVNGEEVVYSYQKPPDRKVFKLTVNEILKSAGFNPVEYELTRDADNHKYTSGDDEIAVEFGERFTATHKGDTPAS